MEPELEPAEIDTPGSLQKTFDKVRETQPIKGKIDPSGIGPGWKQISKPRVHGG